MATLQHYTITMFEYSNSYPVFKFSRLPCADLMVVGLIRRSLSAEEAEEVASWQPKIMSQFMLNILLPAISDLPVSLNSFKELKIKECSATVHSSLLLLLRSRPSALLSNPPPTEFEHKSHDDAATEATGATSQTAGATSQ